MVDKTVITFIKHFNYSLIFILISGISMQSTYSIFKLNPYKIFTLITTTSVPTSHSPSPSQSLIPLYHQFIYSLDIFNYMPAASPPTTDEATYLTSDLTGLLNEQTQDASKLRVHILKVTLFWPIYFSYIYLMDLLLFRQ